VPHRVCRISTYLNFLEDLGCTLYLVTFEGHEGVGSLEVIEGVIRFLNSIKCLCE